MQNRVTITFTDAQLAVIDQALTQLEQQLTVLIALQPDERLRLAKLGDKSEAFCRQSLQMLTDNPQILPPNIDVPDALRDLQARDQLRPRLRRMECLLQRGSDTAMALGSDALSVAMQGYALLKLVGRSEGLDLMRRDLGDRFAKSKRARPEDKKAA
jgi:hypothetical protein